MRDLTTTKMSSKGQVVIPESVRNKLGLHAGDEFVVVAHDDVVILKIIAPPSLEKFDSLIAAARQQARKIGLKKKDVTAAIKKARKNNADSFRY